MFEYAHIQLRARAAKMDEHGASAVEYGLLIAGIAAVIVAVVFAFSDSISGMFNETCSSIANGGTATADGTCATP